MDDSLLAQFQRELEEYMPPSCRKPPAVVYHYTSKIVLAKILESGEFWLTQYQHLNDTTEFKLGERVCLEEGAKFAETLPERGPQRHLARNALDAFRQSLPTRRADVFVGSFSEKDDDLATWRAYAENSRGVALGIDLDRVQSDDDGLFGAKCCYSEEEFRETVRATFRRMIEITMRYALTYAQVQRQIQMYATLAIQRANILLAIHSATLKDSGFEYENEWRLCVLRMKDECTVENTCHRAGPTGVIPYVPIKLWRNSSSGVLKSVIVAPNDDLDERLTVVRSLVAARGHHDLDVRGSKRPFRGS